jgi:hypothetical protein
MVLSLSVEVHSFKFTFHSFLGQDQQQASDDPQDAPRDRQTGAATRSVSWIFLFLPLALSVRTDIRSSQHREDVRLMLEAASARGMSLPTAERFKGYLHQATKAGWET